MDVLVEFRAGRMSLVEGRLLADPRKGMLRVCQDEAGLNHLCWHERDAAGAAVEQAEMDVVIIPGEASFGKIPRPGARVFELKFPEEKQRNTFFWAQEPAADTDDAHVAAVHRCLNMADSPEPAPAAVQPAAAAAPAAPSGGAAGTGAGAIAAADLAAILGNIMAGGSGGMRGGGTGDPGPSLGDVLQPKALAPLLGSEEMVARLAPYLPEEHRSAAAIRELVSTPQFRHQVGLFSHALSTGQLDTSQFGLPPGGFGVADFLRAIQQQADRAAADRQQQQQPQ